MSRITNKRETHVITFSFDVPVVANTEKEAIEKSLHIIREVVRRNTFDKQYIVKVRKLP